MNPGYTLRQGFEGHAQSTHCFPRCRGVARDSPGKLHSPQCFQGKGGAPTFGLPEVGLTNEHVQPHREAQQNHNGQEHVLDGLALAHIHPGICVRPIQSRLDTLPKNSLKMR